MNDKTIILPSARAIRHELLDIKTPTLFLPNYITMSEFIDKLTIVKDYKTIDSDARVLLLMQAADFKEFSNLQIERNFFTFTKNSSYIFKFFEELSAERYDIDNLSNADIYAEYEEHIEILKELYKRYEKLCDEKKILDNIFLPKLYRFNTSYAASHKEVELVLSGYLTNFELELLEKSTNYTNIKIRFSASSFNKKMQSRFAELGIECEENYNYLIDFNNKTILEKEKIELNKNISCESFSESLLQVSFIKKKVYEFVKKGYKPQNIAVILPDEKTASMLKLFDNRSNFNFAMGESFANTEVYKKIDATLQELDQESQENIARLKRVDNQFYRDFLDVCFKKTDEIDF
ncbi:MAG: PD-(D/E)XK nuclease family protein, partial [Campylobacterales bacterium]|nr:PD-(D/E)XK nuclease family protein [Campylobacterales bacterium]